MKDFKPKIEKFKGKNKIQLNKFHQQVAPKKKSINLKKKIRDLERLLSKEGLNEEIKIAKQKELDLLKQDNDKGQTQKKRLDRKEMIFEQKYKKVKGVEETKVRRLIKKVEKQLNENNTEELRKEKQDLVDKLSYIKYFPKDKKYLSLFPQNEDEKMVAKRNEIMSEILKQVSKKKQFYEKIEIEDNEEENEEKKQKNIIPKQKIAGKKQKQVDDFFTLETEPQEKDNKDENKVIKKDFKNPKKPEQKRKMVDKKGNIIDQN